jgi:hypothetical protein
MQNVRFIVVSNREPTFTGTATAIVCIRPASGLASAILARKPRAVVAQRARDREISDEQGHIKVPPEDRQRRSGSG